MPIDGYCLTKILVFEVFLFAIISVIIDHAYVTNNIIIMHDNALGY